MVLYRKYRPQTLDELTGQEVAKKSLLFAFLGDKLSHAYLFTGPRGTGKTSTARILAKMINCKSVDAKSGNPCNKCEVCESITSGANLDLIEIDAASNRGIDDIRSLRETIKLSPTSASKKIYIIDEVHMLTTEAFNALLKTLEEPPSHALFILATTDLQKIPQTILSRVSKVEFKLATVEEIKSQLSKIAEAEKIKIDVEALEFLANLAGGSFRDGVKLLDQVSSFEKISLELVQQTFGQGQASGVLELLVKLVKKETSAGIKLLHQLLEGTDPKQLNLLILENLRQLLLIKNGFANDSKELTKLAAEVGLGEVVKMIDSFTKSLEQLRYVSIVSLPLEVAIVESISEPQNIRVSETPVVRNTDAQKEHSSEPPAPVVTVSDTPIPRHADTPNADIQVIHDRWQYILETIRPHNYSLEALLRSVVIKEVSEKVVSIEVPYSFHQRILSAPKSRDLLESVLSDVLGRTVKVAVSLGQRPQRSEDIMNIELAQDDEIVRVAAEIFSSDVVN